MKHCYRCKKDKPLEDFGDHRKRKDGKQTQCKACRRQRQKDWYKNNAKVQYQRTREGKTTSIRKAREFVTRFLKKNPCVDCGEKDYVVLEFDHLEPSLKFKEISHMVHVGYGIESIEKEISKCQVLCANCHRRKTAKQFNWYKATN
jgi:hypothetical protein